MDKILGIDIGGTNIKFFYELERNKKVTLCENVENLTKESLLNRIEDFQEKYGVKVTQLGISCSGIVEDTQILECFHRPQLVGLQQQDFKKLGIKQVRFINDGNAMAIYAAHTYHSQNVVAIATGTGVACGMILEGKLLKGVHNRAGEIFGIPADVIHCKLSKLGEECSRDCMTKKWDKKYMLEHSDDEEVKAIIEKAGKHLGQYILMACKFLDPEVICISGGITIYPGFFESAKEYVFTNTKHLMAKIVLAEDRLYAGAIGAIYYAANKA